MPWGGSAKARTSNTFNDYGGTGTYGPSSIYVPNASGTLTENDDTNGIPWRGSGKIIASNTSNEYAGVSNASRTDFNIEPDRQSGGVDATRGADGDSGGTMAVGAPRGELGAPGLSNDVNRDETDHRGETGHGGGHGANSKGGANGAGLSNNTNRSEAHHHGGRGGHGTGANSKDGANGTSNSNDITRGEAEHDVGHGGRGASSKGEATGHRTHDGASGSGVPRGSTPSNDAMSPRQDAKRPGAVN